MSRFTQRWWAMIRLLATGNEAGTVSEVAERVHSELQEERKKALSAADELLTRLTRDLQERDRSPTPE